jgi:UDP-glucuronate decarboxylase
VARIFNTFGPRMHMNDGRVVSNFILQALQDQPITVSIYTSSNFSRCMIVLYNFIEIKGSSGGFHTWMVMIAYFK